MMLLLLLKISVGWAISHEYRQMIKRGYCNLGTRNCRVFTKIIYFGFIKEVNYFDWNFFYYSTH